MNQEQIETLQALMLQDSINTIWLVLDHYRTEVLKIDDDEENEEWQLICESMARIEDAL